MEPLLFLKDYSKSNGGCCISTVCLGIVRMTDEMIAAVMTFRSCSILIIQTSSQCLDVCLAFKLRAPLLKPVFLNLILWSQRNQNISTKFVFFNAELFVIWTLGQWLIENNSYSHRQSAVDAGVWMLWTCFVDTCIHTACYAKMYAFQCIW